MRPEASDKRGPDLVNEAISAAVGDVLGVDPSVVERNGRRRSIAALRRLLDDGTKERELQDGLVSNRLLRQLARSPYE